MTSTERPDAPEPLLLKPASPRELFIAFNSLALQGFGGVLPVVQTELVERRRWLTREQFVEMLALSQVLPGPNIVNLALMFGDGHFGLRGAFAAMAGLLVVPMLIVLALTALYGQFADVPFVSGALRGMAAVAAGLVISTAFKLLTTLRNNPMGRPLGLAFAALTVVAIAWLRWPLVWVVAGGGAVGVTIAWRRLR